MNTADDRLVAAGVGCGTAILDGRTFDERYRRVEFSGDQSLLLAPAGVFRGDEGAIRAAYLDFMEETYPLDCFAPILYDPKRFQTAADGIFIDIPHLPAPPELLAVTPVDRLASIFGDRAIVTAEARCEKGILGFQLERDGVLLPGDAQGIRIRLDGNEAALEWVIDRSDEKETDLRIQAIGRSGVLSRPGLLTLAWKERG